MGVPKSSWKLKIESFLFRNKFQISSFKFQIEYLAEITPFEPGQVMLPRE